jgi:hypothetical protein
MFASPKGLGPEKDCGDKDQQNIKKRPVLSSERASHRNKTVTVKQYVIYIWSLASDVVRSQDLLTD